VATPAVAIVPRFAFTARLAPIGLAAPPHFLARDNQASTGSSDRATLTAQPCD
jgi:hypothetical protein